MKSRAGTLQVALSVLSMASLAGIARAQVGPPSWYGVDDGNSVTLMWDFDGTHNFNTPQVEVPGPSSPNSSLNGGWYTPFTGFGLAGNTRDTTGTYGGRLGTDVLGTRDTASGGNLNLTAHISNLANPSNVKFFWYQFDYFTTGPQGNINDIDPAGQGQIIYDLRQADPLANGWTRYTVAGRIIPQPAFETLRISIDPQGNVTNPGSAAIDNLYFTTHCVPEPCSLAALSLGALALLRRKKAKQ